MNLARRAASGVRDAARAHGLGLLIVVVCAGALVHQARAYMPFFVDDSFISLRYVWRLLHGLGLTWTDGERVEGYSDLLWVLLVAAGGLFTPDLIGVSRALGVLTTVLTVGALVFAYKPRRLGDVIPPLAGGLAMILTSPVVAWSIGGLEQPLLAALVAWAIVLTYRLVDEPDRATATWIGILLGLAALTRPDAGLLAATTCGGLLLARGFEGRTVRAVARIVAIAALFALAQVAFRRVYYQDWVPNTAHVKLALTMARVSQGWKYVGGAEPSLRSLLLLALAAAAVAMTVPASRRRVGIPLAGAIVWTGYVVVIGGDISPARRHLVMTIVLLAMVVAEGLHALRQRGFAWRAVAAAVAGVALVMIERGAEADPEKKHALEDTWVWTGRDVGQFLSHAFASDRPLVAVDAAGSLPYYAPGLPCLDMLGLNDRVIATTHPPDFGTGFLGHELGNGAYILSRKPDLIAFRNSQGGEAPEWRGGREMKASPEFARLYKLVTFRAEGDTSARLWVRAEDGRIGVKRSAEEISVPGYLFQLQPGAVVGMDIADRVGLVVDESHWAALDALPLGKGRWTASIEGYGHMAIHVTTPDWEASTDGAPVPELPFECGDDTPVTVVVTWVRAGPAHLERVVFRRVRDG
jgi:hypothetical protein